MKFIQIVMFAIVRYNEENVKNKIEFMHNE